MRIVASEPAARFDNTEFSNESTEGRALPLTATYTCPRCGAKVGFGKQHMEERAERRISNLDPELQRALEAWAAAHGYGGRPFLDWRCPKCAFAARAVVQIWAGARHGDHGARIIAVAEVDEAT